MLNSENRRDFIHPKWSYQSNIYEVNIRQYTSEGTFNAFAKEIPRLADMGVKILWFMPIAPISRESRQGSLGSYYAVQDYISVNPEFGSLDDFKTLVKKAHDSDMKVIVDFVGNHTGNDHRWIKEHPEYYVYHDDGTIVHPHGWNDVSQLNFDEKKVWKSLADAMEFWVRECDIDGFRCDMAHLVPLELWYRARLQVEMIKPGQFWLAECENPKYHEVFDATYTWRWMHATEDFYHQKIGFNQLMISLFHSELRFSSDSFRVYFTSNHDENSWNGTEYEKYGDAAAMLAVFSFTWRGLPMIYSGQELPNLKRLKFFDRDPIEWTDKIQLHDFYKILTNLRSGNPALSAGDDSNITIVSDPDESRLLGFLRESKHGDQVLVLLNFTGDTVFFQISGVKGTFRNVFGGPQMHFNGDSHVDLLPWGYLVYEKIA